MFADNIKLLFAGNWGGGKFGKLTKAGHWSERTYRRRLSCFLARMSRLCRSAVHKRVWAEVNKEKSFHKMFCWGWDTLDRLFQHVASAAKGKPRTVEVLKRLVVTLLTVTAVSPWGAQGREAGTDMVYSIHADLTPSSEAWRSWMRWTQTSPAGICSEFGQWTDCPDSIRARCSTKQSACADRRHLYLHHRRLRPCLMR